MDSNTTRLPPADKDEAARLHLRRARSRRIAGVVVRAVGLLALALLTVGAIAAFRRGFEGGTSPLMIGLGGLQAGIVLLILFDIMYGTQVYWATGVLEGILSRWLNTRARRRRPPPAS